MRIHKANDILPPISGAYFAYVNREKHLLWFNNELEVFQLSSDLEEINVNKDYVEWIDESDVLPY